MNTIASKSKVLDTTSLRERILELCEKAKEPGESLQAPQQAENDQSVYSAQIHVHPEGQESALGRLKQSLGLSDVEIDILLIFFAASQDSEVRELYANLNGHPDRSFVTQALIRRLLGIPRNEASALREALSPAGTLHRLELLFVQQMNGLIEYAPEDRPLRLAERMVDYLLGSEKIDFYCRQFLDEPSNESADVFIEEVEKRIASFSRQNHAAAGSQIVYIHGPEGAGHEAAAEKIARECGNGLIQLNTQEFLQLGPDMARRILRVGFRESLMLKRSLFIPNAETILSSELGPVFNGSLTRLLSSEGSVPPIILAGENPVDAKQFAIRGNSFIIELNVPSEARRAEIWKRSLEKQANLKAEVSAEELASRYKFTPGQIQTALNFAAMEAVGRGSHDILSRSDLVTGCRLSSNRKLAELAKRIENQFSWDDLVLSENLTEQVRGVVRGYRQKGAFYEGWEFAGRFQYGKGISALFGGASGTGKTMAASVIARELDLELYKIDLSTVISKYIGETEKNLARLFKEAETSNAILFFDEADALFGKRSEVKDAHDRHANIEIDFLLQQMEEYEGLTILATNLSQNIDDAFTRRLQFIINFSKPKVAERIRIWKGMIPAKVPLSPDVDFDLLGQNVELPGGSIKNIIFNAGMSALDENSPISMNHIVRAVRIEYLKENVPFIAANFGPHAQQ
jgi:SpoVK/Ycf46/Vps4 family AAA+-type ATPase